MAFRGLGQRVDAQAERFGLILTPYLAGMKVRIPFFTSVRSHSSKVHSVVINDFNVSHSFVRPNTTDAPFVDHANIVLATARCQPTPVSIRQLAWWRNGSVRSATIGRISRNFGRMSKVRSLKQYLLLYAVGFLALVTVAGGLGAYALYFWHQSSKETLRLNSMTQQVQEMRGSLYLQLKEVFDSIFLEDKDALAQYHAYEQRIQTHLNRLENIAHGKDERAAISGLRKSYQALRDVGGTILHGATNMPLKEKQRLLNTELEMHGINNHEESIERIEALVTMQQTALEERLAKLNKLVPLLLALPFLLALALLIFSRLFLQRAVVAPLAALESATKKISAGRLDERVRLDGPRELQSLAQRVNQMASDLNESRLSLLRAEKQATLGSLVPVLAHNIRNPIAAIRATAQEMSDPALTQESRDDLAGIITTTDRLERWTRALLSYLHPMRPNFNDVELHPLLNNVLDLCDMRIEQKHLSVVREGTLARAPCSILS